MHEQAGIPLFPCVAGLGVAIIERLYRCIIDALAPNFKKCLSSVTTTVVRLVPLQAREIAIAAVAPALPDHVPQIRLRDLLTKPRRRPSGPHVWHVRRNSKILAGIVTKRALGKDLKLLFTSASQRRHTGYTEWMMDHMANVISTSRNIAAHLDRPSTEILHAAEVQTWLPQRGHTFGTTS